MLEKNELHQKIMRQLKLDRPIVFFDLETTGLIMTLDKTVELAYIKIFPDGTSKKDDIYLNPEIKISEESQAIHGISNDDVKDKPNFRGKSKELFDLFNDCYYSGFNVIGFDLPFLKREFLRVGIDFEYEKTDIIDAKVIFHYMEPRTLSAAYKFYCKEDLVNAHNALVDIEATAKVLSSQLDTYEETQDLSFLQTIHNSGNDRFVDNDRKFYWRDGKAHFSFSKHKDIPLEDVARNDPGFLNWILSADFSDETKEIVKKALGGVFPKKEETK